MQDVSPTMAMTIDCDKLLSMQSGCLTPLPPSVSAFHFSGNESNEEDAATPTRDAGTVPIAGALREKLVQLAEKQLTEAPLGRNFVKVPLPSHSAPPPAPHAVPIPRDSREKQFTVISKGSVGHPFNCAAACKYVKRKGGCRDGAECPNCHQCFWSKTTKDEKKAAAASVEEQLAEKFLRLLHEEQTMPVARFDAVPEYLSMAPNVGLGVQFDAGQFPGDDAGAQQSQPVNPGSLGHPYCCGPACKYVLKTRGCKDGDLCTHCHLCRWTRYAAKHHFKI
ncbi:unnamed protein product [Effrenium voratum]|uniref:C3H1-type domain-containing protein n=1 Tax=Effrenium voratum TaxID=2562239 RepID=A0AA36IR07_9DINO|nr:unnamed protein product [Effrenium voratum]CAJ1392391.1 unnamed protein product [Effrenium voratum]CAJ1430427.1 unnamed protein product [Effrenium voratum]|mmetsp:Transcript_12592/g.29871  ORF Transcript_12592/g.29871 Transcript_12592/m.29871 type:complete len:279 (+) Transcript_12592:79-915(+)